MHLAGRSAAARLTPSPDEGSDDDALVGVLAHELRTPITTIYAGSAVLARDEQLLPAMRRELATDVHAEAARLFRAVEDLLVLTRLEHHALVVSREPVSLLRAVDSAAEIEGARWPTIRPSLHRDSEPPLAAGDSVAVAHVLRNLIADIGHRTAEPKDLEIAVEGQGDQVRCRLLDASGTLRDGDLEHYFDLPTGDPRPGRVSAGLALFVAAALIDAMGGHTWVRPLPQGPVEIGFALPRYDAA